jgi:hypothetical protein
MPARRTRRQLLAGGTGALAAVLTAEALARPAPAAAASGDSVILGQDNTATSETHITNSAAGTALRVDATDSATALLGESGSGLGVYGVTGGSTGSGVHGFNGGDGNGVSGFVSNAAASGVYGQNDGAGLGVAGRADGGTGTLGDSANGVGVWANSANGTALNVTGTSQFTDTAQFLGTAQFTSTAQFSNSGVLTIAAGQASATQAAVSLTKASLVLATIQQDRPGIWVRSAVPNVAKNSLTVHLSKPAAARTRVAWFVVN